MKIKTPFFKRMSCVLLAGWILLPTAQGALQWETIPVANPELATPKARMLADLDTLEQFLIENWAEKELNSIVYGIDIKERFAAAREKITDEMTPDQYFSFLNDLLISLKGGHLSCTLAPQEVTLFDLGGDEPPTSRKDYGVYGKIMPDAQEINKEYEKTLREENKSARRVLGPQLLYWEGDYYLRSQFRDQQKVYPAGMKLLRVNGRPVKELVTENQNQLRKYDFDKKQFYGLGLNWRIGDNFYEILPDSKSGKPMEFVFADQAGEEVTFTMNPAEGVRPEYGVNFLRNPLAVYLEEPQILYCHVPKMTTYEPFWSEIQEYRNQPIKAIIIDIRHNPGGSDGCWMDFLSVLMAEPSKYVFEMVHANSEVQKKYRPNWTPEPITLLNNTLMLRRDYQFSVEPKAESLNFTGPIYILCREIFSASGKLQVFATASDQLITVGERNPMMIGEGSRPAMFCLPESRIFGSIKLVVNVKGAKAAEDILHTRPEVELKLTLAEALELWNQNIELPLEERMMQSDPYIRKVLELEKERQSQVAP